MTYATQIRVAVPIVGTAIAHGLGATPAIFNWAPEDAAAATAIFFSAVPADVTNLNLTASVTGTGTVSASLPHSIFR
jgi:hypothetical protein